MSDVELEEDLQGDQLIASIIEWDWEAVLSMLASHPHTAEHRTDDNCTMLDVAIWHNPPLRVLDSLITLYPPAVSERNDPGGKVLLHYVTSAQVVRRLLHADPGTALVSDDRGRTPLLWGKTYSYHTGRLTPTTQFIGEELSRRPFSLDANGRVVRQAGAPSYSPFEFIPLGTPPESPYYGEAMRVADLLGDNKLYRVYEKACLIVQAAYLGSIERLLSTNKGSQLWIVHACAAYSKCPAVLLRLAMWVQRGQLSAQDDEGNLPLHLAARSDAHDIQDKVSLLLEANPEAASIPNRLGKMPLHLAAEANLDYHALDSVMTAYQTAIQVQDPVTIFSRLC